MSTSYTWELEEEAPPSSAPAAGDGSGTVAAELLPRQLRTDPDTGDLVFVNGSLVFATGVEAIAQDVRERLRTWRGEWFLDESIGVPYLSDVLVKRPNLPAIRALLRQEILAVPGVLELTALDLDYDNSARRLEVDFRATTDTGELVAESVEVTV